MSDTAAYYRTHPEARAKRQRAQAEINRRPSERKRRDGLTPGKFSAFRHTPLIWVV
jgi:hypothetical protein